MTEYEPTLDDILVYGGRRERVVCVGWTEGRGITVRTVAVTPKRVLKVGDVIAEDDDVPADGSVAAYVDPRKAALTASRGRWIQNGFEVGGVGAVVLRIGDGTKPEPRWHVGDSVRTEEEYESLPVETRVRSAALYGSTWVKEVDGLWSGASDGRTRFTSERLRDTPRIIHSLPADYTGGES